jgi:hypothetical protein
MIIRTYSQNKTPTISPALLSSSKSRIMNVCFVSDYRIRASPQYITSCKPSLMIFSCSNFDATLRRNIFGKFSYIYNIFYAVKLDVLQPRFIICPCYGRLFYFYFPDDFPRSRLNVQSRFFIVLSAVLYAGHVLVHAPILFFFRFRERRQYILLL